MRYFATVKGQAEPRVLDIEETSKGTYAITLDGQRHEVDALSLPQGVVSLLAGGQSFNLEFEEFQDELAVAVRGQHLCVDIVDERRRRMRAAVGGFSVQGKQVVTAPMPGKVVKVLVAQGQEVSEGQGLIVVEAMKMENELKSPKAGKVTELFVKEGSTVENNAKLMVVE
jgi:biotin carboxyl carrier protein